MEKYIKVHNLMEKKTKSTHICGENGIREKKTKSTHICGEN